MSPPSGIPDEWDGPVGSDAPLTHQEVVITEEADTGEPQADDTAPLPSIQPTVIVLVTDGARVDETLGNGISSVTGEPTENFLPRMREQLLPAGTMFTRALNTGVTVTSEGHGELVSAHRIPLGNFPSDDGAGAFHPSYPTLFESMRTELDLPRASAVVAGNSAHLQGLTRSLHPLGGESAGAEYLFVSNPSAPTLPASDDAVVIDSVRDWMTEHDTRLVVANLHQIDRAGHSDDSPTAYAERIKDIDIPIVEFWQWIQADARYQDRTTLIVLSDHGRHRVGTEADHRHHGDSCSGCREIPVFMAGPRIRAGHISDTPVTLADVGKTISEILGFDMPLSTGRVLSEALIDPPAQSYPDGALAPAASQGVLLAQEWTASSTERSSVTMDGTIISTEGVLHAEAPVFASRDELSVGCWRELRLGDGEIETWPWLPNCIRSDGDGEWSSFRFPVTPVSPYFHPSLRIDHSGQLWASFIDNPEGTWESTHQKVQVYRWTESTSWQVASSGIEDVSYPMHPTLLPVSDGAIIAYISSDPALEVTTVSPGGTVQSRARYRRHARIHKVRWLAHGSAEVTSLWRSYTSDHFAPDATAPAPDGVWEGWASVDRVDRPALGQGDREILLAYLAVGSDGGPVSVRLQTSDSDGATWSHPAIIDDTKVAAHITPVISGGVVYWARSPTTGVEICRWSSGSGRECIETGAAAVEGLSVDEAQIYAGVLIEGSWQVLSRAW